MSEAMEFTTPAAASTTEVAAAAAAAPPTLSTPATAVVAATEPPAAAAADGLVYSRRDIDAIMLGAKAAQEREAALAEQLSQVEEPIEGYLAELVRAKAMMREKLEKIVYDHVRRIDPATADQAAAELLEGVDTFYARAEKNDITVRDQPRIAQLAFNVSTAIRMAEQDERNAEAQAAARRDAERAEHRKSLEAERKALEAEMSQLQHNLGRPTSVRTFGFSTTAARTAPGAAAAAAAAAARPSAAASMDIAAAPAAAPTDRPMTVEEFHQAVFAPEDRTERIPHALAFTTSIASEASTAEMSAVRDSCAIAAQIGVLSAGSIMPQLQVLADADAVIAANGGPSNYCQLLARRFARGASDYPEATFNRCA